MKHPLLDLLVDPNSTPTFTPTFTPNSTPTSIASLPSSIVNLANSIIGAGVLTLPYAIKGTGIYLGLVLLAIFASLSALSLFLLDEATRILPTATSYSDLGRVLFAKKYKVDSIVDFMQSAYSYGSCVGYLSILVDELEVITTDWDISRPLLLSLCLIIVFPLTLLKSLSSLSFTSTLAIICVSYLSIVLVASAPYSTGTCSSPDGTPPLNGFLFTRSLSTSLPIFCFAFNCQVQFLPLKNELQAPTRARIRKMVFVTMLCVFILYGVDASAGYLSFCQATKSNILDNYGEDDVVVFVARVAFVAVLNFSFPLYSTAIVTSVDSMIKNENKLELGDMSFRRRVVLASAIVFSQAFIVNLNPDLDKILGLTGAIGGCSLVYVFPGLFYDRAKRTETGGGDRFNFGDSFGRVRGNFGGDLLIYHPVCAGRGWGGWW